MSRASDQNKVPGVSIDEALELFLAVTCPNGLPEGEAGERLKQLLRNKIAGDRPQWAAASEATETAAQAGAENEPTDDAAGQSYSQLKAAIAEQAQGDDIPEDPGERYFYQRHKEARENRERLKQASREEENKQKLLQQLKEKKEKIDESTLGQALKIRMLLENKLQQKMGAGSDNRVVGFSEKIAAKPKKNVQLDKPRFTQATGTKKQSLAFKNAPARARGEIKAEELQLNHAEADIKTPLKLSDMSRQQKIEYIRSYNQARKDNMVSRNTLLNPRRPKKPDDEGMLLTDNKAEEPDDMSMSMNKKIRRNSLA